MTEFAGSRTAEHTVDAADVTKSLKTEIKTPYHKFSVKKGIIYSGHTGDNS